MPLRLYLSPELVLPTGPGGGPGTTSRPLIADLTPEFVSWPLWDSKPWRVCLTRDVPSAVLDAIDAETDIRPLSPRGTSLAQVNTWLGQAILETEPLYLLTESLLKFNLAWTLPGSTRREVMQYIGQWHRITVEFRKKIDQLIRDNEATPEDFWLILRAALNDQVNTIPTAKRQRIIDWLTTKGVDLSGISGTDTIRQALQEIVVQLNPRAANLGFLVLED